MLEESKVGLSRPHLHVSEEVDIDTGFGVWEDESCLFGSDGRALSAFFILPRRCCNISMQEHQINEEIRDKEVRLIDSDGSQLGVMNIQQALDIAIDRGLDLVKIAPKAEPPVCRIMDYGKFRFEQAKKEKEARKNQKVVDIKEVRLSAKIDVHDFEVRVKNAQKFLKNGDKVKASIRFRGREMAHTDIGLGVMNRFAEACAEFGSIEKPAKLEGRQMLMFLAPLKNK